jgi:hypothetical protein
MWLPGNRLNFRRHVRTGDIQGDERGSGQTGARGGDRQRKGRTGKSTIAMHMAVAFANAGGKVGSSTSTRARNRFPLCREPGGDGAQKRHHHGGATVYTMAGDGIEELAELALTAIRNEDLLIIDTPGRRPSCRAPGTFSPTP